MLRRFSVDIQRTIVRSIWGVKNMSETEKASPTVRDKALAQRRMKILEAAVMCFLENGYHQTGVRDIAKKAGVSLGNLYNHFPGKHDILAEIAALERLELAPFLRLLNRNSVAPKLLEKFITSYTKYVADPDTVILSLEIAGEAVRKPDIADMFLENRTSLAQALSDLLDRGIAQGDLRPLPDTQEAAFLMIEMIEGCAYRCVLEGASLRKSMKSLKDLLLASVAK